MRVSAKDAEAAKHPDLVRLIQTNVVVASFYRYADSFEQFLILTVVELAKINDKFMNAELERLRIAGHTWVLPSEAFEKK